MSTAKFTVGQEYKTFYFDLSGNNHKPDYTCTKRTKRVVFLKNNNTGHLRAYPIVTSKVTGHEMVQFIGGPTVFANQ